MAQDWFAQGTAPVQSPRSGRVIVDPYVARDEDRKDDAAANERERLRLAQESARLQAIAEARQQQAQNLGNIPEGHQLIGGVIQPIPGYVSPAQKNGTDPDALGRVNALVKQINTTQGLFNTGPGATGGLAGLSDYMPSQEGAAFDKAAAALEDIAIGAFKVPGMGSTSDLDATRMAAAIRPNRWGMDAGTRQQLSDVRSRLDEWFKARGLPTPTWEGATPAANVVPPAGPDREAVPLDVTVTDDGTGYADSYLGQGLSGINEGISDTLGLPVDLMTSAMNLIPGGINAIANTNIGQIENPTLGSEWWRGTLGSIGSILPEAGGDGQQFARRMGQSVGAAAIPIAGTASTVGRAGAGALTALAGGAGAATAQQVAPGNPWAELAGEVVGSGLTGGALVNMASRGARRSAEAAVPTVDQLKAQAGKLYDEAESRGVVGGPNVTANLAGRARQIAKDEVALTPEGRPLPGYESINSTLTLLDDFAGKSMSAREVDRVRRATAGNVQKASDPNERRINRNILEAFDEETLPLAPEFADARKVASRYLQAEDINQARDLAEVRASQLSNSGMENALRTDFRSLDRNIVKGDANFAPAVEEAIQNVSRGDPTTNALRAVGKLAPRGIVSTGISTGVPFAIGNAIGGPVVGGAASAATAGVGELAKRLATQRTVRGAELAELLARNGGPIVPPSVIDEALRRQLAAQAGAQSFGALR